MGSWRVVHGENVRVGEIGKHSYSSRQGYAVIEPFDPTTAFILSVVEGLRAPLRSGNYEI
jgi:hypothetical protein